MINRMRVLTTSALQTNKCFACKCKSPSHNDLNEQNVILRLGFSASFISTYLPKLLTTSAEQAHLCLRIRSILRLHQQKRLETFFQNLGALNSPNTVPF
jgi:hypothetical protein